MSTFIMVRLELLINYLSVKEKMKSGLVLVLLVSMLIFSCQKQSDGNEIGLIEVKFSLTNLKSASSENTDTIKASTLTSVIVTIEDLSSKGIKNSEKVELYNMNGNYISKPLSLPKGNYKLTRFLVLDWQNNVVYASPLKGSAKAYLVTNPLPLTFAVQANIVTMVTPEVLNAAESKPEDFGYSTFSFSVAQTFDFMVGTFIYDATINNYKLTPSTISIYTDTVSMYSGQLTVNPSSVLVNVYDSLGVTNKITLPERYNKYSLVISKPGYSSFSQTFTKEELKLYFRNVDKGPLVVILDDGLVAYYKFNGDVLDYSGHNNNGTYYGRGAFASGYKPIINGSIDLNGSTDYVFVKNSPSLSPTKQISLCAWYYSVSFYGSGANEIVCKENTLSPPASLYGLAVQGNLYNNNPVFAFNITTGEGAHPIYSSQYQLNTWYFVVGVYDGTTTKLYVNGVLNVSKPASGNILNSTNNIFIGNTEGMSRPAYDFLPGRLDEIRIYNRALSDAEIVSLYQQ